MNPADPNFSFLNDLWTSAKQAGPFATMLMTYMWFRADSERQNLQKERDALLERVVVSINSAADAVRQFSQLFSSKGGGG